MNPIWGQIVGVFTTLIMLAFIGIWIWAWHKSHKPTFDRLASLPMEDADATDNTIPQEKHA
ncbi:MAG TPA: cbb3-type cytochrome c oxidase subunit 3 [Rhodanobacteraceae bacterium]|nr:cbb3-type cytochrome c oxidase subunit 3 [Rhodanobacteraceae bacterium]